MKKETAPKLRSSLFLMVFENFLGKLVMEISGK